MTPYFWLCLSALAAGACNAVAGGGTLFTFPALLAVVSPVVANATSTVALVPASIASAWGYRRELTDGRQWLRPLIIPSIIGGTIGSLLVTRLEERYFETLIPWLILTASVLLLVQPLLSRLIRVDHSETRFAGRALAALMAAQFVIAIYGGYFGAGIGILMLASLGLMGLHDIHQMNAIKTILAACINGVSVLVFVAEQRVDWKYAVIMAVAAIAGGYLGASLARRLNRSLVRWVVVIIGFALAANYFYKQYNS